MKKQVKFSNWLCDVVFAEYRNGGTAIRLVDAVDGMPVATDRKSTRLNSSHSQQSRMPSSA